MQQAKLFPEINMKRKCTLKSNKIFYNRFGFEDKTQVSY